MFFDTDIKFLKGVGERRAKTLTDELGLRTFRDLAFMFPYKYVDRSRFYVISELSGEMPMVQIRGCFISFNEEGEGARKRLVGVFTDGRKMMQTVWFSKISAIKGLYRPGVEYVIFGKPSLFRNVWSMAHPEVSKFNPENPPSGFRGIYSLSETSRKNGFTVRNISALVENLLKHPGFQTVPDTLPAEVVSAYRLMPMKEAIVNLHFPETPDALQKARERMKFEELFYLQMHILRFSRERGRRIRGEVFARIGEMFNGFYNEVLPFPLTGAQKRVLREIREDMRTGRQMNRLLQGDVGSGKTLVAFMTMLMGADNGCQSAMMAPTEILATQHYETIREWAAPLGLRVELLTGSTRVRQRRVIHEGLENGDIQIIVGTHALIEDTVKFRRLGVAVIDEQHRFGVAQRARMWQKSAVAPHVLVMTATPIPRTLAMTVYGDLDVSVIDELPPGRKPVTTLLRFDENRGEVNRLLGRELAAGRQAYIVYPLITDNPKLELKSVENGFERISGIFPQYRVCMVHGRMKPDVKEEQMRRFISGEARIMVATTVIEVGVNVPNASVMVIENAERFGLSQLHQLRGRVGRGSDRSYCVLVTREKTGGDTRKRLGIMTETSDGFVISEADMRMRGPGDMEGTQQSGLAFSLQVANLTTDGQILALAREAAGRILDAHPELLEREPRQQDGPASGQSPIVPIAVQNQKILALSASGTDTLCAELRYRFAKSVDWSRIS